MPNKRVTSSPIALQLHLTRKCNLNCYYCGADEFRKKEKEQELNTKEWVNLLERLKEIQVFDVAFSGGEIFLRKDIFEILETAIKCKFPKMRLTTNGTLISDAVAKRLKSLNFKNIGISLDGNKETHEQIRGAGSFTKTIEGIS
ncbi:MAG: radical SAM protein, partial [Methanosarcinales archaeon]